MAGLAYSMRVTLDEGSVKSSITEVCEMHVMLHRRERAVALGADHNMLVRLGAATDRAEHLGPLKNKLHRSIDDLRRHGSEHHMGPRGAFAAKAAAGVRAKNPHVVVGNSEGARDGLLYAGNVLRRIMQRELLSIPLRDGGVRLHGIVSLHRAS